MYSNIVLNVFKNPKNAGRMKKPEGVADCYNEDRTAHVEFFLRIENGIIIDCKFRAQANPYIIAICSTMTNMVKGKMVSMTFLDPYTIKSTLGDEMDIDIMFCIDCFKLALQDYKEKLEKEVKDRKKTNKQAEIESQDESFENEVDDMFEEEIQQSPSQIETTSTIISEPDFTESVSDEDDDFDFSDFFDEEF